MNIISVFIEQELPNSVIYRAIHSCDKSGQENLKDLQIIFIYFQGDLHPQICRMTKFQKLTLILLFTNGYKLLIGNTDRIF